MPIQILPPDVANQIAAGEVVERPASVVKELIENSVDAGATDIRVEVREGGRRLIRVQDNGCGIPAADTAALFQRHATSKISRAQDLDHLTTLGFRGEALASIGSVAQVSLLTHSPAEEAGSLVRIAAGREMTRAAHGAPPGTTVSVEHLFANVPARLKFLKQPATETGHIYQIITRYALAYPELRLGLVSDGKLAFQSTGSGKLYDVLVKIYGLDAAKQMLRLEREEGGYQGAENANVDSRARVSGYIGIPALHRGNRSYITLFINRRWFQDASLAYGVIQAYHTLLPVGRFPVAVIFIELDPAEVDVNVHPAKAEVRFREGHGVFGVVQRAVRRTLTEQAPIPGAPIAGTSDQPETQGAGLTWEQLEAWSTRRDALLNAGANRPPTLYSPPVDAAHEAPDDAPAPAGEPAYPSGSPPGYAAPKIPLLRVIGQVGATYIVAEGPDGLYLIDQHAAHERILYERMLAAHAGRRIAVQPLLEPLVLTLSPEQAAAVGAALPALAEWGIALEAFGGQSYLLRSLPALLSEQNPESALSEIADGLARGDDVVGGTTEARLVTLICKRAAVKGGHVLGMTEMQELVRQLEDCAAPRTCPHGRPTMIHVSAVDLARQFGRL